ncbi:MAG TPA: diacylglycerol kinase family protein [Pseudolysinimonas sp.]|nr:diacylglycerol kinase family protein [Pseudolysinimonas sp.]
MSGRMAGVVYNPIKVDLDALKASVAAEPGSADWTVEWFPTSEEDPGQGPTRAAVEAGAAMVIAAGGDGTVRAVAEVLRGTDVSLSLLPSGTGNLLARNLKLTLNDTAHSLRTAFTGGERSIDVAGIDLRREDDSVDSHAFLVMAGAGLDAKIMSNTDDELKKRVGWLAYAGALVRVLRDKSQLRLQYKLDQHRNRSERAQAIIVGNCGSLPANIMLLPDAAVDDGLLDLIVVKPESVRGWLAVIFKIFWENGVVKPTRIGARMNELQTDSVEMRQGRSLTVRLSRPEIVELDGDPFGEIVGCRIAVEPGALTIKVPADGD